MIKKLLLIFIISLLSGAIYGYDPEQEALDRARDAFLATKTIKEYSHRIEKRVNEYMPVDKEVTGWVGSAVITAYRGEIDTKVIKNMDVKIWGNGKLRPDIIYDWKDGEINTTTNFNWSF